jgi:hypothetical protein
VIPLDFLRSLMRRPVSDEALTLAHHLGETLGPRFAGPPPGAAAAPAGAALAWAALDHIHAHPEEYDRLVWIARPTTGGPLVAGFDARVCLLAGDQPDFDPRSPAGPYGTARVTVGGVRRGVRDRACELLGLDPAARNPVLTPLSTDGLAALVEWTFGPRPVDDVPPNAGGAS